MQTLPFISLLSIMLVGFNSSIAQSNAKAIQVNNSEKCFGEAVMGNLYEKQTTDYYIYTGNAEEENVELDSIVLEISPKKMGWVREKRSPNCASPNPEDCLVACYVVLEPAVIQKFAILKDPSQSKNVTIKSQTAKVLVREGGYTEEIEVLCEDKITPSVVKQLQRKLKAKHFNPGRLTRKMNPQTKEALMKFQKKGNLPVGQLDFKTLNSLRIEY